MHTPLRFRRAARSAALATLTGAVALTFGCDIAQSPPTAVPVHTRGSLNSTWPEEPSGFTALTDYGFSDAIPSGEGAQIGSSPWYISNTNSQVTQLTNQSTAPVSASTAGQWAFPSGFTGGAAGTMYANFDPEKEVFFALAFRASDPLEPNNGNERQIAAMASSEAMLWATLAIPSGGSAFRVNIKNAAGESLEPDENQTNVTLGAWHKLEWYVKYSSTASSGDGIIRWWLDGTLQGDYTNQNMPADDGFLEYRIETRWDGSTKAYADDVRFDHVYVSAGSASEQPTWPNEPAEFSLISDYGFPDAIPQTGGDTTLAVGGGWSVTFNNDGDVERVTGMTDANCSPDTVGQWRYPTGFQGGEMPGKVSRTFSATKRIYVAVCWKPSSSWQSHGPSYINKIHYLKAEHGSSLEWMHMAMFGPPGGPFRLDVEKNVAGVGTGWNRANVDTITTVELGVWHKVEWLIDYTATGSTGRMRWWLDGQLIGDHSNVPFPLLGFNEYEIAPVWGGVDSSKTQTDYYWFDHVRLSK